MFDVFFYEAFEEEAAELKKYLPGSLKAEYFSGTIQEHGAEDLPAAIISTRTQSIIPPRWAGKISAILTRSTGYDTILKYREEHVPYLPCGYLPRYCSRAVAEQAMLLWMALLRKLPRQIDQFSSFGRDGITGKECKEKTLLVVGVGNIGIEIVHIGKALGMNVLGVDITEKCEDVNYISIDYGLGKADVIVCAMNLTKENIAYFGHDRLKKVKPGAVFVNIARGEMTRSADLLTALEKGALGGVGLDVFNKEELLSVSSRQGKEIDDADLKALRRLAKHENVILTPHNAFNTEESVKRKAEMSARQIEHFSKCGRFLWEVPSV